MSKELTPTLSTWFGRPLSKLEMRLFCWCEDERQAITLAKVVPDLPEDATAEQIEVAVIVALCTIHCAIHGFCRVEIVHAERRDNRRVQ